MFGFLFVPFSEKIVIFPARNFLIFIRNFWEHHSYSTSKIKKAGCFKRVFSFGSSRPIVTRGTRVSRAPPHHTLTAFLNLHVIKLRILKDSQCTLMVFWRWVSIFWHFDLISANFISAFCAKSWSFCFNSSEISPAFLWGRNFNLSLYHLNYQ